MSDRATTAGETHPPCRSRLAPLAPGLPMLGLAAALLLARNGGAAAFPLLGTDGGDVVPQGTELPAPAALDLQHQLGLVNGLGLPSGGGWTFLPFANWQEMLTDNVLEVNSPRRADLVSFFAPGINIAGDMPRAQLTLNYSPTLSIYARTGSLNSLTEQLNGLGSVTLVPDLAFMDIRAVAGVQSAYGGLGGLGTVGAPAGAGATASSGIPALAGNSLGLNKDNEFQTSSFSVSPYLLRRFGDWGTGRLGDTVNLTRSDQLSGFFSSPVPTGGINGQTMVLNDANAHFVTGDFLQFFQDTFDADLTQSRSTIDINGATLTPGTPASSNVTTSSRAIITDQLSYAVSKSLTVFASGGHEDISYTTSGAQAVTGVTFLIGPTGVLLPVYTFGNTNPPRIDDLTWSLGGTWTTQSGQFADGQLRSPERLQLADR